MGTRGEKRCDGGVVGKANVSDARNQLLECVMFQGKTPDLMAHTSRAPLAARVVPTTGSPRGGWLHFFKT